MTTQHTIWPAVIALLVLIVVSLACSLGAGTTPAEKPTEEPTLTSPIPTQAPTQPPAQAEPTAVPTEWVGEGRLGLEKTEFRTGEMINVTFQASPVLPEGAWIGIIPSDKPHGSEAENDQYDIDYQYIGGHTSGTLAFAAPGEAGAYDFRMHDTDADGKEIASIGFTVVEPDFSQASLTLAKTDFKPGETIQVSFSVPEALPEDAWMGIIPSDKPHGSEAENDQYDIDYQYIGGQMSGTLAFDAPGQAGAYDFRLHDTDDNGKEIAWVGFTVVGYDASQASLTLAKTDFKPGETIQVSFSVPEALPEDAWIGIIPSDKPHGSEAENDQYDIDFQYIGGQTSGTLAFAAPGEAGAYDFRMHDTDDNGTELTFVSFTVQ